MKCELCGNNLSEIAFNSHGYTCQNCDLKFIKHYTVNDPIIDNQLIKLKINIGQIINFYIFRDKDYLEKDFKKIIEIKSFI